MRYEKPCVIHADSAMSRVASATKDDKSCGDGGNTSSNGAYEIDE